MKFKPKPSPMVVKSKILAYINEWGERGVSVEEIDKALVMEDYFVPLRTIQRRLQEMQPDLVIAKGGARATRYYKSTAEDIAAFEASHKLTASTQRKTTPKPDTAIPTRYSGTINTSFTTIATHSIDLTVPSFPPDWNLTNTIAIVASSDGIAANIQQARILNSTTIQITCTPLAAGTVQLNWVVFRL